MKNPTKQKSENFENEAIKLVLASIYPRENPTTDMCVEGCKQRAKNFGFLRISESLLQETFTPILKTNFTEAILS